MIEIILALIAVALLIGLIYHNKRDDIRKTFVRPISRGVTFTKEFQRQMDEWAKHVNSIHNEFYPKVIEKSPKKRRNNVPKKRKIRNNKTKKARVRKS